MSVDISIDVSWTGDLPKDYGHRPTAPEQPVDLRSTAGVERPAFERYDLDVNRVEARVWKKSKGPPDIGRVVNSSITGMWIESKKPFSIRTELVVTLLVPGGYSASFPARVVRATRQGMAVHLQTDDSTWQFRSAFIELARKPGASPPSVVLKKADKNRTIEDLNESLQVLGARWHEVLGGLDDDIVHQEFIEACLDQKRLEFALERYRELRGGPDDEVASRYLAQIGMILGFMGLDRKRDVDDGMRRKMISLGFLVLFVVIALVVARQVLVTQFPDDVPDAPAKNAPSSP